MRSFFLSCAVFLVLALCGWAARPLSVDDAAPAEPGTIELEAGVEQTENSGKETALAVGATYGVAPGWEIAVSGGAQILEEDEDTQSGVSDSTVGVKWRVIESCPLGAEHALAGAVKLPTADRRLGSRRADYDLSWIVSRPLPSGIGAHVQVGHTWVGGPERNVLHYGAALDFQLTEKLQAVMEIAAEQELSEDPSLVFRVGGRWQAGEAWILDAAVGMGTDELDFTATIGVTWSGRVAN